MDRGLRQPGLERDKRLADTLSFIIVILHKAFKRTAFIFSPLHLLGHTVIYRCVLEWLNNSSKHRYYRSALIWPQWQQPGGQAQVMLRPASSSSNTGSTCQQGNNWVQNIKWLDSCTRASHPPQRGMASSFQRLSAELNH